MGNAGSQIENFFTQTIPNAFNPVGQFFGDFANVFEVIIDLFLNIGKIIRLIFFLINNFVDLIYGGIVFMLELAKEIENLLPFIFDIIEHIIDLVDYFLELVLDYWEIPVAIIVMIPAYVSVFFLVNRLNSVFD